MKLDDMKNSIFLKLYYNNFDYNYIYLTGKQIEKIRKKVKKLKKQKLHAGEIFVKAYKLISMDIDKHLYTNYMTFNDMFYNPLYGRDLITIEIDVNEFGIFAVGRYQSIDLTDIINAE